MSKFNVLNLLKNAKQVQGLMEQAQEELSSLEVVGESGGGAVRITMNARHNARLVEIDDETMQEPKAVLEGLIAAAINDAATKIDQAARERMMDATKRFGINTSDFLDDDSKT